MDLKELCDIALILDGVDFREFISDTFDFESFYDKLGYYKVLKLKQRAGKDLDKYVDGLLAEYQYELMSIKSDKPCKPSKFTSTVYENLMSYLVSVKKSGFNPEQITLKDAKTIIEINNRNALQANIYSVRSQLNISEKAIFDMELDEMDVEDYENEVEKMLDNYIERIRNPQK